MIVLRLESSCMERARFRLEGSPRTEGGRGRRRALTARFSYRQANGPTVAPQPARWKAWCSWVPVFAFRETGMTTLGAQALAALGAAAGQHLLSVLGGHAQAEAVAAGANETRRLKSPLHGVAPGRKSSGGG